MPETSFFALQHWNLALSFKNLWRFGFCNLLRFPCEMPSRLLADWWQVSPVLRAEIHGLISATFVTFPINIIRGYNCFVWYVERCQIGKSLVDTFLPLLWNEGINSWHHYESEEQWPKSQMKPCDGQKYQWNNWRTDKWDIEVGSPLEKSAEWYYIGNRSFQQPKLDSLYSINGHNTSLDCKRYYSLIIL